MSYSNIYNRLQHLQAAAIQQLSLASPSSQLPVSLMSPCTDYSCGTTPVLDFMSGGIGNPLALTMSVPSLNLPVVSQQNQMAQLSQLQSAQPSTPANEPDSSSIFSSAASAESQRDRAHLTLNFDGAMRRNTNVMRNMAAADSTVSPMALPRDLIDTILATTPDSQKYLGFSQQFLAAASSLQQAQQQGLETPTPTRTLYPKHVTKAQEVFVDGFQKALLKLQADRQNPGGAAGTSQQTPQQRCLPPTFQYLLSLLTPTFGLTPQFLQPHFLQPHTPTQQLTTPINVLPLSITAATEVSNSSVTSTTTPTFTSPTSHRAARKEDVKTPQAVKRKSTASTPLSEHVDVPAIGESSPEDDVVEVTANTPPAISSDSSNASGTTQDSDATTAKKEKRAETPPGSPIIHKPKPISGTENTTIEVLGQITKLDPNNSQGYMEFLQQQGTSNFNMAQFGMQNCANSNASNNNNMQFDSNSGFGARHQSPQQHQMVPQQHLGLPQVKQEIMNSFQNLSNSPQMRGCGMASTSAAHMFGGSHPNSLDLDDQERRKLERKRARNRMAASKCRQRKMERIQELEIQVQLERQRNAALQNDVEHLKRTIFELNNQLTMHKQAGCSVNVGSTPFKVNNGMN